VKLERTIGLSFHWLLIYLLIEMKKCFLLCVRGLIIAYIICCRVNVTLDIIKGTEDILISWFVIILALLHQRWGTWYLYLYLSTFFMYLYLYLYLQVKYLYLYYAVLGPSLYYIGVALLLVCCMIQLTLVRAVINEHKDCLLSPEIEDILHRTCPEVVGPASRCP